MINTSREKVILFGASSFGKTALETLENDYDVIYFCDNDSSKWGTFVSTIEVISPDKLSKLNYEIIITSSYVTEISDQLRAMQIDNYKVFTRNVSLDKALTDKEFLVLTYQQYCDTLQPWDVDWREYYFQAETSARQSFDSIKSTIGASLFNSFDFSAVLDFACGYGRIASHFSRLSKRLICCDINYDSISYCRDRFVPIASSAKPDTTDSNANRSCLYEFIVNDLEQITLEDASLSFIYSWDAMVHFDKEMVERYVKEFSRLLQPGGYGFIHHSNYATISKSKKNYKENSSWRGHVTKEDVCSMLEQNHFRVVKQQPIPWNNIENLDCISVFQKI